MATYQRSFSPLQKPTSTFSKKKMSFMDAIKMAQQGFFVCRPSWGEDSRMWWEEGILMHNKSHIGTQLRYKWRVGYAYVCEEEDVVALDWEICELKEGDKE